MLSQKHLLLAKIIATISKLKSEYDWRSLIRELAGYEAYRRENETGIWCMQIVQCFYLLGSVHCSVQNCFCCDHRAYQKSPKNTQFSPLTLTPRTGRKRSLFSQCVVSRHLPLSNILLTKVIIEMWKQFCYYGKCHRIDNHINPR